MIRYFLLITLMTLAVDISAEEDEPTMELLLFLADFVKEDGSWDGPEIDEQNRDQEYDDGVGYE